MFINKGTTKGRTVPGPTFFLKEESSNGSGVFVGTKVETRASAGGIQITESDGNPWPPRKRNRLVDYGSEFYTRKEELVTSTFPYSILKFKQTSPSLRRGIVSGSLVANCLNTHDTATYWSVPDAPPKFNFPPDLSSSREELVEKGTQAIAACAPSNQITQVASSLGELFQQVPTIPGMHTWESRLGTLLGLGKGVSSDFLNVAFGVIPTLADMTEFVESVHKYDKALDQFIRDAGRVVRRDFQFPKEIDVSEETLENVMSPIGHMKLKTGGTAASQFMPNYGYAVPGYKTYRRRTVERETWFSGAFTYHLPTGYDYQSDSDRRRLMAKLFGAEPDLNTLWQLAPWSWAVDWFSNASSVVKNLQNFITYGSVMPYGYVMETTTITDIYTAGEISAPVNAPYVGWNLSTQAPLVSGVILRTTVKKRIQANPFGFGMSWDGLSSFQSAILAAIGITRAVK